MMFRERKDRIAAAIAGAALVAMGVGAGFWLDRPPADRSPATSSSSAMAGAIHGDDREVLYWYDPMVPDQHFDKPGKSPFMDMDLVPKYADDAVEGGVRIDPVVRQNLGVRSATVEVGRLDGELQVPGTLTWDLRSESLVSVPVEAIVSRLHVRAPYERVDAGTPLAVLLAPAWASAIAETRAVAGADSAYGRELRDAARQRLRTLGLSGTTATGTGAVILRAPRAGVVREILVREGEAVMPGTALFRINGTGTLWLEAALPQSAAAGVAPGTPVTATVTGLSDHRFEGWVETVLPEVDEATRTRRVRIVLRNQGQVLAPGMFAEVTLKPDGGEPVPLVPSEAVIATGTDTRVITIGKDGRFRPVSVTTGRSVGGRTEILSGLAGGERVVTSGQFLIDSEANLSGALDRLAPPDETTEMPR
jgi:Cu(I)/Ag(I) efflux system membrane fusion protein